MASVPKIRIFKWDNKKGHLDKWRFYENDKLAKIRTRWQKRHVDNCGLTKMTYFAKPANLARIETVRQQNSHIDSWQFSQKWQNLRKWRFEQESTHELVKPQTRWQRGEDWQKANFDKYGECAKNSSRVGQIFKWDDKKGHVNSWLFLGQWQILRRWRNLQEVIKGLTKIYKEMTKSGILTH